MAGKSDFNENPVVSLDLDLDFGLLIKFEQCTTLMPPYKKGEKKPLMLPSHVLESSTPLLGTLHLHLNYSHIQYMHVHFFLEHQSLKHFF